MRIGAIGSQFHVDDFWGFLLMMPVFVIVMMILAGLAMGYLNGAKWAFGGFFKTLGSLVTGRFYNLKSDAGECIGGFALLALTAGLTWGAIALMDFLDHANR